MKAKHIFLSILASILLQQFAFAQANILNALTPEEIGMKTIDQLEQDNDTPLPYSHVEQRDILWGKNVWERIDLDERVNLPLYYPVDTFQIGSDRRSLYDVLVSAIKSGDIEKVYSDSYFTEQRNFSELQASLQRVDTTDMGYEQLNAGEYVDPQYIDKRELSAADITEYRVRGYWYFDRLQGELRYRLLGIAPVAPDVNFIDSDDPDMVELFWVWYKDARQVLHDAKVFNQRNSAFPISFDDLLNARRFSSIIYKEDNIQGDRFIKDYIIENPFEQLIESDRIKESIRNFELDMWSY